MRRLLLRTKAGIRDAAKPASDAAVGALTSGLLRTTRYFDPIKTANLFGRVSRFIGRRLKEDKIGRANLTAAFPEKSPRKSRPFSQASGTTSAASAPSSRISITSGSTILPTRRTAASRSNRAPMSYSRSFGSTASRR